MFTQYARRNKLIFDCENQVPSVAVDEEGFSIRPEDASNFSKFPGDRDKGKQKSDSDSDSDPGEGECLPCVWA